MNTRYSGMRIQLLRLDLGIAQDTPLPVASFRQLVVKGGSDLTCFVEMAFDRETNDPRQLFPLYVGDVIDAAEFGRLSNLAVPDAGVVFLTWPSQPGKVMDIYLLPFNMYRRNPLT